MTTIAVLGTGNMGAAMARRLATTGHSVVAWNRTASRAAALTDAGVRAVTAPADAVRDAEFVITMLSDAIAVDAALFGVDGAATALSPGACLMQMSTIGPAQVSDVAARLPAGIHLVDAPVAGSVGAAEAGTLRVLAAGADPAVERARPALTALGTIVPCGPLGAGSALKLVLNTALVTGVAAVADVLAVADAVGLDRDVALGHLDAGPLGGAVQRVRMTGASFSLALAAKDLDLALAEVGQAATPVAWAAAGMLRDAPDPTADISALVP
ncbi:NAD(P)-dependent oxidoreductase [Plantactinospora sp. GCM10030261]|uniref:NAD(P)-dependent oxidoreductase n=1 Tax=Plantactinospora sp. GCM10030261 TaxID=3273420 RepID=UPI00361BA6A6